MMLKLRQNNKLPYGTKMLDFVPFHWRRPEAESRLNRYLANLTQMRGRVI